MLAAVTLASSAAAVKPEPGQWVLGTGEGQGFVSILRGKIVKGATAPSTFKCNKRNAVIPKSITVRSDGTFSYSGALKGQSGRVVFKGRFKTARTVSGSARITNGSCSSKVTWKGVPAIQ